MTSTALDVAIIGAGTAGLSARAEVAKITESYRVFDPGPYGTTCARAACMPSKAILQSAHDFHRRHSFAALGIVGAESLQIGAARVMAETRALRDQLVEGVIEGMEGWRERHLVAQPARFEADGSLRAGETCFRPRATVIATGSRPVVPPDWRDRFGHRILTTDGFFDLKTLPRRIAVVGLGAVGLELGQALARLGVEVTGFDPSSSLGGLEEADLQSRLREALGAEMTIVRAQAEPVDIDGAAIRMRWDGGETDVDCMLVAIGRAANIDDLGLDTLGVELDDDRLPVLPAGQLNPAGRRLYFAGDAGRGPALLHEASDEGRIAGYFAARGEDAVLRRRAPLRIVFCDPQIAVVGTPWSALQEQEDEVAVGEASFDRAGRNLLQRGPGGAIRIYANKASARLLGAAILAPEAEHLAHLLAHAITREDDLAALLRMPAYHPTHEEVLRRALRAALENCNLDVSRLADIRCKDPPVDCGVDGA